MSGPITVLVSPGLALPVLLAASAIRAARAVQEAYVKADALHQANEQNRQDHARQQANAQHQGLEALHAQAAAAEQRLAQLAQLSERLGDGQALQLARPERPRGEDHISLADYVSALEAFTADAQAMLMAVWAGQASADESLDALGLSSGLTADAAASAVSSMPSARLLRRIVHLGQVPAHLLALAEELDQTTDQTRAELLASELRRQVQLHAEKALQEEVQRAQALVVEQSLQDLGYEVEEIESTLFVEGGVAHFRKSHWGDYMVRMRVVQGGGSVNFNVVRAVDAGQAEGGAASVQDHLAEDRWCAEFPALLKALAARGVKMEVTRRLEAGELPVQRVARDRLPRFAEVEENPAQHHTPPMARPLQ